MVPFHAATLRRPRTMKVEADAKVSMGSVGGGERTLAMNRVDRIECREVRRECRDTTESLGR